MAVTVVVDGDSTDIFCEEERDEKSSRNHEETKHYESRPSAQFKVPPIGLNLIFMPISSSISNTFVMLLNPQFTLSTFFEAINSFPLNCFRKLNLSKSIVSSCFAGPSIFLLWS